MSKAIQRFSLDVTHPDVQASVRIMQGDDNRQWRFTFTEAGRPFDLPARCTAMLVGTKPDDTAMENGLVVKGNEVIYDFGAADPENGIEQISTVPGSFEVQILLFDEYGAVLHAPRLWVTVFSSSYTERMANVSMDQFGGIKELIARLVGMEGNVETLLTRLTTSGTFTIPPTEWTDHTPHQALVNVGSEAFSKGCVVLVAPENDATKEAAGAARMSMAIDDVVDGEGTFMAYVMVARAESGTAPTIPLNFRYVVLKTGTEDKALVAMIGVDAVGEGGTGGSGGTTSGVDESAVRAIINQVVPAWARASNKPTYTKSEIGLGNVDNVKQYSNSNQPDYPVDSVNGKTGAVKLNADDVGARSSSWMPTAAQVGADPSGTAATKVSDHDTYTGSHNDIRLLIKALQEQVNKFLDVDDTTRDELSEVLAMIDANAGTLESLTSSKVNVTDIINNLTTNVKNKPLSAAQGVALKALIDALSTGKLDASALGPAITTALKQAKESGEFDCEDEVYVGDGDMPDGAVLQIVIEDDETEDDETEDDSPVQSDWNQTDETAADFIKNKPFGDVLTVIFDDTVTFDEESMGYITLNSEIKNGDSVAVEFDGTVYECVAYKPPEMTEIVLGNLSVLGGEDTGEPFAVALIRTQGAIISLNPEVKSASVKFAGRTVVKLNRKYITNFIPMYLDLSDDDNTYLYTDVNLSRKVTSDELVAACEEAPIVLFYVLYGITMGGCIYPYMISAIDNVYYVETILGKHYTAEYTPTT